MAAVAVSGTTSARVAPVRAAVGSAAAVARVGPGWPGRLGRGPADRSADRDGCLCLRVASAGLCRAVAALLSLDVCPPADSGTRWPSPDGLGLPTTVLAEYPTSRATPPAARAPALVVDEPLESSVTGMPTASPSAAPGATESSASSSVACWTPAGLAAVSRPVVCVEASVDDSGDCVAWAAAAAPATPAAPLPDGAANWPVDGCCAPLWSQPAAAGAAEP